MYVYACHCAFFLMKCTSFFKSWHRLEESSASPFAHNTKNTWNIELGDFVISHHSSPTPHFFPFLLLPPPLLSLHSPEHPDQPDSNRPGLVESVSVPQGNQRRSPGWPGLSSLNLLRGLSALVVLGWLLSPWKQCQETDSLSIRRRHQVGFVAPSGGVRGPPVHPR